MAAKSWSPPTDRPSRKGRANTQPTPRKTCGSPAAAHAMADVLYQQHDQLAELRKQAQKDMITEARKHPEYRCVKSCPGLGNVRSAQLLRAARASTRRSSG
jgi:hypothetical protein